MRCAGDTLVLRKGLKGDGSWSLALSLCVVQEKGRVSSDLAARLWEYWQKSNGRKGPQPELEPGILFLRIAQPCRVGAGGHEAEIWGSQ